MSENSIKKYFQSSVLKRVSDSPVIINEENAAPKVTRVAVSVYFYFQ